MEIVNIQLSQLTLAQKIHLMEAIWDDLSRGEDALISPPWHEDILKDRDSALAAGKVTVSNWQEAKARNRRNVLCE